MSPFEQGLLDALEEGLEKEALFGALKTPALAGLKAGYKIMRSAGGRVARGMKGVPKPPSTSTTTGKILGAARTRASTMLGLAPMKTAKSAGLTLPKPPKLL